ncbi:hypothetical protein GHK86_04880 [Acidimicrobiaceae bacterium USS-CC1]|uniref:Oligosaccharide flippase family protein n=1 Tax=Acidiferrimicrobium australe TaxID=2664430 RepID=A0ABW9QR99_9ACTN|nr:hypothetical protein [Acidiferrimicrobium australe]
MPLLRNASYLYVGTMITSLLGFAFWNVAARAFTPSDVGIASALIAGSQLVADVAILGLGTLMIAKLAEGRAGAGELLLTGTVVTVVTGLLGGVIAEVVLTTSGSRLADGLHGWAMRAVFASLASLTTAASLWDNASVGLLRGRIQLARNSVFAAAKLAVLALLVTRLPALQPGGGGLLVAWEVGMVVSLVPAARGLWAATPIRGSRVRVGSLLRDRRLVFQHHWLNLSVHAPYMLLPMIVATVVSPRANAGFYTAELLVGFVAIIPSFVSTTLFALKPGDRAALRRELRAGVGVTLAVAVAAAVGFGLAGPIALELFSAKYLFAGLAIRLLGLTVFPAGIKAFYVAVARVHGRMGRAAVRTSIAAAGEVTAAAFGGASAGLSGAVAALVGAYCIEMLILGPTVLRASRPEARGT